MLIKLHRIDPRTQYTDIYVQMTAFKPFFVSLTLPYSIRRGEEFALQATVFNYLSRPLQVHITCLIMTDYITIVTDSLSIPFCLIVFSYCLVHIFVQQSRFGLCRLQWHSKSRITSRFVFLTPFYLRSKPYRHLFRSVWNISSKYPLRNVLWCLFGYKTERWHTCRNHLTLLTPEHFL